jgi:hypothetical protein
MQWIEGIISREIQKVQGFPDLKFSFIFERTSNQLEASQVNKIDIESGQKSVDEVRVANGLDEIGIPPFVMTAQGPLYLRGQNPQYQAKYKKFFDQLADEEAAKTPPQLQTFSGQKPPGGTPTTEAIGENKPEPPPEKPALPGNSKAALDDLRKWRKVALRCAKDGKAQKRFESVSIPDDIRAVVETGLEYSSDIQEAFAAAERQLLTIKEG